VGHQKRVSEVMSIGVGNGRGGWGPSQFLQKGAGPSLLHLIPVIALPTDIFRSPITFISYHYHDILSVIYSAPVTKWI